MALRKIEDRVFIIVDNQVIEGKVTEVHRSETVTAKERSSHVSYMVKEANGWRYHHRVAALVFSYRAGAEANRKRHLLKFAYSQIDSLVKPLNALDNLGSRDHTNADLKELIRESRKFLAQVRKFRKKTASELASG